MQAARRRPSAPPRRAVHPRVQGLEQRLALAIDLANVGQETAPPPFGVIEAGQNVNLGAGWSVAEVGDVNNDGFDDFLIGAPTINLNNTTSGGNLFPTVGNGANAQTYLVFGSNQVNTGTFDFLNLNPTAAAFDPALPNQRAGDLGALGNAIQANPRTNQASFAFNGLTFITGQNSNSALGASVAGVGDVNGDNVPDFMIGAPGANNSTGTAYLIYGSPTLSQRANKIVDLDNNTGANNDLGILTFTNLTQTAARTGRGVAGVGDWIADGLPDVAIGAPDASPQGLASQGAVYVISGQLLAPARTTTIDLSLIGQGGTTGLPGVVLVGETSGDRAGTAVGTAGNTAARTTAGNQPINDLLIGSPDVSVNGAEVGTGSAYLIYGDLPQTLQTYIVVANNFAAIPLVNVGNTVPGAEFTGDALGDRTGFAVGTAGDFNGDGFSDFLIGSPGWDGPGGADSGRATMIYGRSAGNPIVGASVPLSDLVTAGIQFVEFDGAAPGALAGFSVTATAPINADLFNEIALGSPGFNGGTGLVYLIPGNQGLVGTQSLASVEQNPVQGLVISNSDPTGPNLLGTSVSGSLFLSNQGFTVDADALGDLIVGAAGLSLDQSRALAGAAYALEGAFLPLPTPVSTAIVAQIGIDQPFPPFTISATQPPELLIYVFSDATTNPPFVPPLDIDPTTVVVNGVAFPNATIATDPVDENNDGLPDAIITISPRTALGLRPGTNTIVFNAQTLPTSPNANRLVIGTAQVTVPNNGGGGGLPSNRNALLELGNPNAAVPPFGGQLVPNPAVLAKLRWRRMGTRRAFKQFLPQPFFAGRFRRFYHGPDDPNVLPRSRKDDGGYRTTTLGRDVFTRGKYPSNGVIDARRVRRFGPFARN